MLSLTSTTVTGCHPVGAASAEAASSAESVFGSDQKTVVSDSKRSVFNGVLSAARLFTSESAAFTFVAISMKKIWIEKGWSSKHPQPATGQARRAAWCSSAAPAGQWSMVFVPENRRLVLPPELERELTVIEFELPGKEALRHVLDGIKESASIQSIEPEQQEKVIDAACGLTTIEAENAFDLSFVQRSTIEPSVVAREKAQAVKKNGLLEIVEAKETLESIGGLDVLKSWLLKRKDAFGQRAKDYGLPTEPDSISWTGRGRGWDKKDQADGNENATTDL